MISLKYFIILILIFSYKISLAQTWKNELIAGTGFIEKEDYPSAILHFQKAKANFNIDTLSIDYATILYLIGSAYSSAKVYDSSLNYHKRAFKIIKTLVNEDAPEYEISIRGMGEAYYDLGNYSKALELYEKDMVLMEKIYGNNSKEYEIAIRNLAEVYNKLKKYDEAERYYINALKLNEQLYGKESSDYLLALTSLADLYINTENYTKVEELGFEIFTLRKKIFGAAYHVNNILRLAYLYIYTGAYPKAEPLLLEALSLREHSVGINHPDYIKILYHLGELYFNNENYSKAEAYFLKYANKIELLKGKENFDYAKALNSLGKLYIALGDYKKAEKYIIGAITFCEKQKVSDPKFYPALLGNLADCYRRSGNEQALALYEKSISNYKKTGDTVSIDYAITVSNLAIAYDKKDDKISESLHLKALEIIKHRTGEKSPQYLQFMLNMGVFYTNFNIAKAEPYLLFALSKESKLDNTQLSILYMHLAMVNSYQKKYFPASTFLLQSAQTQTKLLTENSYFMTANQLEQYFSKIGNQFINFNNYLYKHSKQFPDIYKQSYNNELQNKGFVLRNIRQVQNAIMKNGDTALINTLENFRSIKNRLSKDYSQFIDKRPDNINELEAKAEELEKTLVQESQAFRNLKEELNLTWEDVQNKLGDNEVAIEFISFNYYNPERSDSILYGALVLRPGYTEPHFVYLFEQKQLEALLQKQPNIPDSSYFNNLYQYSSSGKLLHQLIWQPLDSLLTGVNTIYAAPSGLLHTINITSLPVSGSMRLGQQYQLHIMGTTGDIVKKEEQYLNKNTMRKAWLFGGIDYDKTNYTLAKTKSENNIDFSMFAKEITRGSNSSWPFLKSTLYESAGIDSLCKQNNIQAEFISGSFASETAFKNISGEPSSYILHLATHGYFFPDAKKKLQDNPLNAINNKQNVFRLADNPLLRSGLIFSGANKSWNNPNYYSDSTDDGILTAYEVSNLDLSGAKLVVMSACETGLGEIKGSEGVFGLQRSFKLAGAENIIMSLWKVPDLQTKELMELFYENCFKGMSIADALKNAQFTMSEKYPPYYWAAFKLLE